MHGSGNSGNGYTPMFHRWTVGSARTVTRSSGRGQRASIAIDATACTENRTDNSGGFFLRFIAWHRLRCNRVASSCPAAVSSPELDPVFTNPRTRRIENTQSWTIAYATIVAESARLLSCLLSPRIRLIDAVYLTFANETFANYPRQFAEFLPSSADRRETSACPSCVSSRHETEDERGTRERARKRTNSPQNGASETRDFLVSLLLPFLHSFP